MSFLKRMFKKDNYNDMQIFNDTKKGIVTVKMNGHVAIVPYRIEIEYGNDFANNLKMLRKVNNLTQEQLAKNIGVAAVTIITYENRRRNPNGINLCKLARYFGVDAISLLGTDIDK